MFSSLSFITSAASVRQLPPDDGLEVAFAGRSNAGKSSAINALAGRRALARASKTPGRTRQINFFRVDDRRRLVDLPGYGFARAPLEEQRAWARLIEAYLRQRRSLAAVVLLTDARRPLTAADRQLVEWCEHAGLGLHVVLTKADKLSRSQAARALEETRRALGERRLQASAQLFSATRRQGVEALASSVAAWLAMGGDEDAPGRGGTKGCKKKAPAWGVGGE